MEAKGAHLWDRASEEWYQEPGDCTTALLSVERFRGIVWDPACGGGNVVKAVHASGRVTYGTDIVDRGCDPDNVLWRGLRDFLGWPVDRFDADNIVTNPPFGRGLLTEAFIRHAMSAPLIAKAAFFVDLKFLASTKRATGLFRELPPSRIWIASNDNSRVDSGGDGRFVPRRYPVGGK